MSLHDGFAAALIDPAAAVPPGLTAWNGSDPVQRFAVYRNNVIVSLITALRTTFPVLDTLVGTEFFNRMVRAFVASSPPRSTIMATYGETFPAFVETFAPAATVPYLADVARLEIARVAAYHAPDAPALGAAHFAAIAPEDLGDLNIVLHPSATILTSPHAIASIWSAHQGIGELSAVVTDTPEDVLIVRPDFDVTVTRLAPGVAAALLALHSGKALGAAVAEAAASEPAFDAATLFQTLIAAGAAMKFELENAR